MLQDPPKGLFGGWDVVFAVVYGVIPFYDTLTYSII